MNDFTKDFAQALFNPDKINDLLRKELQQAVNNLLEAELTAFLGYDPYARNGWNTGKLLTACCSSLRNKSFILS